MKKLFLIIIILSLVFLQTACAGSEPEIKSDKTSAAAESNTTAAADTSPADVTQPSSEAPVDTSGSEQESSDSGTRILISYFSATGTTKKIAELAADVLDADIYEIVPEEPYTPDDLNYSNSSCRANTEMEDPSCRPKINGSVSNMADYDIVFIGYPIWWGKAPRIISTFIESYDFSDKTVVTFSTSGSSSHSDSSIKELTNTAAWVTGTRMKGNSSRDDVAEWIDGLDLDISPK